jgi:hypothetical protein
VGLSATGADGVESGGRPAAGGTAAGGGLAAGCGELGAPPLLPSGGRAAGATGDDAAYPDTARGDGAAEPEEFSGGRLPAAGGGGPPMPEPPVVRPGRATGEGAGGRAPPVQERR